MSRSRFLCGRFAETERTIGAVPRLEVLSQLLLGHRLDVVGHPRPQVGNVDAVGRHTKEADDVGLGSLR